MQDAADIELLRQYADNGSEEAFAAIAARHVNMVYSAALRKTGNPGAAEEITQAVFVLLARKAAGLGEKTILSGWLYQAARLTAAHFLRGEFRRVRREQEALMQSLSNETEDEAWREIAPVLEDAMGSLGGEDRNALVQRFFERKSFQEIGIVLGASENAAKKRVAHALEKLRKHFSRRGIHSTTAVLAGAIMANSIRTAPAALADAAAAGAWANGAAVSTSTLSLIKGALKTMAWTKAKMGAVSAIVLASLVAPLLVQHQAQARLRDGGESLRGQTAQLAALKKENERLSILAANSSLSQQQLNDLQKLRAEAGPLRRQAEEIGQLRQENRQLAAKTGQDKPRTAVQLKEEAMAKAGYGKNWVVGFYHYAEKHNGQFPTNFEDAAAFVPDKIRNLSGVATDQFEIVFQGSPSSLRKPQDIIVLREKEAQNAGDSSNPPGQWMKIYTFADGHSELHHEPANNFDDYESAHMIPPAASNP
ncbi:MAG TPA: sigma-70 family RNA polymerase sigma factor [Verrucomicrobiae bacterium]|jgi:RNA polymerase sigma factor (sigma-70 family)